MLVVTAGSTEHNLLDLMSDNELAGIVKIQEENVSFFESFIHKNINEP